MYSLKIWVLIVAVAWIGGSNGYILIQKIRYSKFVDWKKSQEAIPTNNSYGILSCLLKFYYFLKLRDLIRIVLFYSTPYTAYYIRKGWYSAETYLQFMSDNEHDAIIIVHEKFAKKCMYGDGIDILIEFFRGKGIPYKLYACYDLNTFEGIVRNQNAINLWIFGHGSRGEIKCGNQSLKYEKLKDAPPKRYIYQFHCNLGNDASLAEYLSNGRGFVSNRLRDIVQNREQIKQILEYWRKIEEKQKHS
jgi:hypothetical protein